MTRFSLEMRNLLCGVKETCLWVQNEGSWIDGLILGIRIMTEEERDFPRTRKIHHRYTEEIRNVGLQVHSYFNGCKLEEGEGFCFRFKFDWSHYVSPVDWVLDVSEEHQTRYLFCCECSQLVYVRTEADSLDCCKTCARILTWHCGIWSTIWFRMWLEIARFSRLRLG